MLEVYLAIPIILFVLVIIKKLFFKSSSSQEKTAFMFGESGSGKTSLIYLMALKKKQETLSSTQTNQSIVTLQISEKKSKEVAIIDIPGHAYIEDKYYKELNRCHCIIIVVDSTQKSFDKCAHIFYNILVQKSYQKKRQLIIFALNKQDLPSANKSAYFDQ